MSERASKIQLAESPVGIEIQIQETQKSEAENDKRNDISYCTKVPSAKMNVPLETANYPTEIKLTYYHERDIAKGKSNHICTRTLSQFSLQRKKLYLQIVYSENNLEYCKLMYEPELQTTIQSGFTFFALDLYRCSAY
ncbi:hypothetical protein V1478_003081 [Vespula squamosa]|uniref:Uncharacterized protein n=1 Tax=Vespula squamosa TaxID=30214 RepID=A0ABD2BRN7_VESSQ